MSVMIFMKEKEGIKLANSTMYGLSTSARTTESVEGLRVAYKIVNGCVKSVVNAQSIPTYPLLS